MSKSLKTPQFPQSLYREVIRMNNNRRLSLLTRFLLASLLLHCLFALTLRLTPTSIFTSPQREIVELEVLDSAEMDALPAHQIVQQNERDLKEEENKNAKLLSALNQTVLKETVAERRGEFKNAKTPGSEAPGQKSQAQEVKAEEASKMADKKKPADLTPEETFYKDLTKKYSSQKMFENIERKKAQQQAQNAGGRPGEVSQTSDFLKGKDPGLETLLNTREYKYYTYFNRIRRRLSEHWEPKVKERMNKMFRQGRSIASTEERVTKLLIVLNDAGVLVKVQVLSDSGIHDLDEAAIDAFRAAAPFPHPPKGIVDSEGTIKIRWDFILET